MKSLSILLVLIFSLVTWAGENEEINAKYQSDNANYIYMASKTHRYKLKKEELTKEGVKQILKNKEVNLTLFIPKKSIVKKTLIDPK